RHVPGTVPGTCPCGGSPQALNGELLLPDAADAADQHGCTKQQAEDADCTDAGCAPVEARPVDDLRLGVGTCQRLPAEPLRLQRLRRVEAGRRPVRAARVRLSHALPAQAVGLQALLR